MKDYLPFTRPTIDEGTIAGVADVLRSGWITTGPQVTRFEGELAAYLGGGRQVRSCTSATGALEMALAAAGIGPGDEVIVPAMSFAASANVVVRVGAVPVFVDVGLRNRNIETAQIEAALTPRTRAIMPVHFAGLSADLDAVHALASRHGLRVIEDAAHAIGSAWRGRKVGSFGDIVCFSFHPNKNITTIEGGALVTADAAVLTAVEQLRFHGIQRNAEGELDVVRAGGKYNFSDVSACIGIAQLAKLESFNRRRRELAARYFELLQEQDGLLLPERGDQDHSWHIFTVLIDYARFGYTRPRLQRALHERGIGTGVHYPSIPALTFYRQLGHVPERWPNALRIGRETLTLPLFPAMRDEDVERVVKTLWSTLRRD
jgi:dTDP-4-amino-4,6-dideoxygalactose transaminase